MNTPWAERLSERTRRAAPWIFGALALAVIAGAWAGLSIGDLYTMLSGSR